MKAINFVKKGKIISMEKAYFYDTEIGRIMISEDGDGVTGLSVIKDNNKESLQFNKEYDIQETELIKEAAKQVYDYLKGFRREFDLKLNPKGTDFQRKVWEALRTIPYGETRSYKQIACIVGNEKACRAVGMANNHNPIMLIIPCHRVIGANGNLVGFGAGLDIKKQLLDLEKSNGEQK